VIKNNGLHGLPSYKTCSYVHGIMYGEVPAAMEAGEGGYHLEEFTLD
jgi:hypothetical protein